MENTITNEGFFWYHEGHTPNAGITIKVKKHLFTQRSDFQLVEMFDTYEFGRMLTLDRLVMVTERDECAYHEMLAHVSLLTHPNPQNVLIIGGGDGGTLREVLKHNTVHKAVEVEIDGVVVDASRKYFGWAEETYSNPRAELIVGDGIEYLKHQTDRFDVILIDSSDPIGPAAGLFQEPFYRDVFRALKSDGILAGQMGSMLYQSDHIGQVMQVLKPIFPIHRAYTAFIPTYPGGGWAIAFASKKHDNKFGPDLVRYNTFADTLKYYNPELHLGAFALPQYVTRMIE